MLAKERSPVEVVNDLNGDLVHLYRNVQYHLPALLQEVEWTLGSRKNLFDFIAQPGLTEIQRAARWLIRNKISFGGGMTSFGVSRSSGVLPGPTNFRRRFPFVGVPTVAGGLWSRVVLG